MDIGQEVGQKAHLLFPGGVRIAEEPWQHAEAVTRTAKLMNDAFVPAIFEAAFDYEDIRIRVDVLERLADGAWGLREVKSSSGLKDHYLDDVAVQTYVLRGAGIAILSIELLHVNTDYVRGPGGMSWTEFFTRLDVGEAVAAREVDMPARLPAMRDCLSRIDLPAAKPGSQCGSPYTCEFWDHCTADKPADWIGYFPRLSETRASELKARGIEAISDIPSDFPLTPKQDIIRDATASGQPYVATELGRLLDAFGPPASYLDFEAMMPPIPLYEGTRPYQTIPFQWSLHTVDGDGVLNHTEFLADGANDPRRQFAETLIDALACSDDPIIVYSAYERTRLKELAADFPDLNTALNTAISRLADLLPIVRSAVYFPEFRFSNSIKSVAPALCPGFSYDDLDGVADGGAASAAFLLLASGRITDPGEVGQLRAALLAYCKRDTLAMVEVHQALARLAAP
ncbi:DUF2779 domain-containing protein [Bradyrhizobium sp. F1.13.3]|uniref:DUF2779 domain-containing protein n=1 Tax=Bradyrhizobium sp. F1.13.3 TaxID=3156351 RepID=UPI003394CE76